MNFELTFGDLDDVLDEVAKSLKHGVCCVPRDRLDYRKSELARCSQSSKMIVQIVASLHPLNNYFRFQTPASASESGRTGRSGVDGDLDRFEVPILTAHECILRSGGRAAAASALPSQPTSARAAARVRWSVRPCRTDRHDGQETRTLWQSVEHNPMYSRLWTDTCSRPSVRILSELPACHTERRQQQRAAWAAAAAAEAATEAADCRLVAEAPASTRPLRRKDICDGWRTDGRRRNEFASYRLQW